VADDSNTSSETAGINRLLGMVVQEVSLVDRAANKRTLLLIKRDEKMSIVTKDDTAAAPAMPGASSQPAPEKLAPMQAQVKDQLLQALTAAAEKIVALANQVKEAETTEQQATPAVPASVTGEITETASMLSGLAAQFGGKTAAADPAAPAAAPPAAPPGAPTEPEKAASLDGISENGGQDQQGEQKRDADAVAKAYAIAVKATNVKTGAITLKGADMGTMLAAFKVVAKTHSGIQKAGKKMAKERLDRFRKAMDMLAGIMKELTAEGIRKSAGAPSRGMVLTPEDGRALLGILEEAATLNKAQSTELAALRKRNAVLERSAGAPNSGAPALALPGDYVGQRQTAKDVVWPMDMNKDPKTTPATSFRSTGAR
jgi:hypothetical protein